jgi:UDP-N-acetylmuramate dehydrogenase
MVLDRRDPESVSLGSFFLNPVLSAERFAALERRVAERRVAERLGDGTHPPSWPEPDGAVKTSAAWLIERAGFQRGFCAARVGISTKHALALVNRGDASTTELIALARQIRNHIRESFGVLLHAEPTLVGVEL